MFGLNHSKIKCPKDTLTNDSVRDVASLRKSKTNLELFLKIGPKRIQGSHYIFIPCPTMKQDFLFVHLNESSLNDKNRFSWKKSFHRYLFYSMLKLIAWT